MNCHLIEMSSGKATSHPLPIDGEKSVDALDFFLLQEEVLQEEFLNASHAKEDWYYVPEMLDTVLLQIMAVTPFPLVEKKIAEAYASRNQTYQTMRKKFMTSFPTGFVHRAEKDNLFAIMYNKIENNYLSFAL